VILAHDPLWREIHQAEILALHELYQVVKLKLMHSHIMLDLIFSGSSQFLKMKIDCHCQFIVTLFSQPVFTVISITAFRFVQADVDMDLRSP
jgi:hypothetical protein